MTDTICSALATTLSFVKVFGSPVKYRYLTLIGSSLAEFIKEFSKKIPLGRLVAFLSGTRVTLHSPPFIFTSMVLSNHPGNVMVFLTLIFLTNESDDVDVSKSSSLTFSIPS